MVKLSVYTSLLLISICEMLSCNANQIDSLNKLIKSRKSGSSPHAELSWENDVLADDYSVPVYVGSQAGLMGADEIDALPGQPGESLGFKQYAGYVPVDPKAGRELFYYFVESTHNSSTKPLLLWLNGGPGCSSFGYGAMQELGPFRVNSDGKTLYPNEFAWNNVANILFLESPAGVGFSYSNTKSDYKNVGDKRTALDSYTFLLNWLERFPKYKTRDFFIAGESYAGHYVPQLAYTIVTKNNVTNQTKINLKGIAIGNAWIDDNHGDMGFYEYMWTHALNSDQTYAGIHKYCDFVSDNLSNNSKCTKYQIQASNELGYIDIFNIYAPLCNLSYSSDTIYISVGSAVNGFDPCSDHYVDAYLNLKEVQAALHVKSTSWSACRGVGWTDSPPSILPTLKHILESGIKVWIYSGDIDGRVPVTSTRYSLYNLSLPIEAAWRPWHSDEEVGGYVTGYKGGLTFATVRGAGHMVPSYQPKRALTLISSFLQGKLPPS